MQPKRICMAGSFFFVMKIGSLFNAEYSFQHRPLMPKNLIYSILDQHYYQHFKQRNIMNKNNKKKEGWTAIGVFVVLLIIGAIIASQNDYTPTKDHHADNAESSSSFDHKN